MTIKHRKYARSLASISLALGLLTFGSQSGAEILKTFEGWKLYNSSCILCHGARGDGDGNLAARLDLDAASFRERRQRLDGLSDRQLADEIKGNKGHFEGMPKWRTVYADPQIDAMVAYVRYLSRSRHPLEANPEDGQRYYARYCVSCHGDTGKGDGFLSRLVDMKPADHSSPADMDPISNTKMAAVIRDGKEMMPGWKGIITEDDISELVSYIRLLSHSGGR